MRHSIRSDTAKLTMKTFLAVRIARFLITTRITRRFPDEPKRIIKAYNVIKDPNVHGATLALYFQSFTISSKNSSITSRSVCLNGVSVKFEVWLLAFNVVLSISFIFSKVVFSDMYLVKKDWWIFTSPIIMPNLL